MKRLIVFVFCLCCLVQNGVSQSFSLGGHVLNQKDNAIEFASIYLLESGLWSYSDEKGGFVIENIPKGVYHVEIQCLGYNKKVIEVNVHEDNDNLIIVLEEHSIALNEVYVTAQKTKNELTTSYTLDRTTLDHAQILNVSDIGSLLPGGKSNADLNLASSDVRFQLQSESGEMGNATFGTAVMVDGVRLESNSAVNSTTGIDTRNISSTNIESVEIITGIPSVEYGDLSNGVVKINTRKGKSPFIVEMATQPKTKQVGISKGFDLGNKAGTLNMSVERTNSISNLASPFTSYDRNTMSLTYSNNLNRGGNNPLSLTAGVSGNIGGYNSKADPDSFLENYSESRDNNLRGNINIDWLLNKSWITNLEFYASASYSDKLSGENSRNSSASTQPYIHSMTEGYFIASNYDDNPSADIILSPVGYWYRLAYTDSKPVSYNARLKASWSKRWGHFINKLLVGAEYAGSGNEGRGLYYDDMRYAPTWREYRYDNLPYLNNIALYGEDKITVPMGISSLQLTGGLRYDMTYINNSDYDNVNSLSPRVNAKFIAWQRRDDRWISDLSIYGGWGKAVKLPSFEVLYPSPSYSDRLSFAPGTLSDGTSFYAYYSIPSTAIYNSDLEWQYTNQTEIGIETTVRGAQISVSAFRNITHNPYMRTTVYTPFSYKQTTQEHLNACVIPLEDRVYSINEQTGIVTVGDRNGVYPDETLDYNVRNSFKVRSKYVNASPVARMGINWIVDFDQIKAIKTSFRLDGTYYYYKGLDKTLIAYSPTSSVLSNGNQYPYIGYYGGGNASSASYSASASVNNGNISQQVDLNLTVTTHIPKLRLIVTMRIESSLFDYEQRLCEYTDGSYRGFALENIGDYFGNDYDLYDKNKYVATYPLYYSTWDDPNTLIPFAEKLVWARDNDPTLYNNLTKLVQKSNYAYIFNTSKISPYFSANLNITKEIGEIASISFYATNFFNQMGKVKTTWTGLESSLFNSSYISSFYYGLSLRLKI